MSLHMRDYSLRYPEPDLTKHPERIFGRIARFYFNGISLMLSGLVFAIAVMGG